MKRFVALLARMIRVMESQLNRLACKLEDLAYGPIDFGPLMYEPYSESTADHACESAADCGSRIADPEDLR